MNLKRNLSLGSVILIFLSILTISGNAFAASDTSQDTPVTAKVTVDKLPDTPDLPVPVPGSGDDTSGDNTKQDTSTANVSIAYHPIALSGSGKLDNTIQPTSISLSISDTQGGNTSSVGHVGVKDQTKEKNQWKLQATYTTSDAQLAGSTITLNNGKVQMNNAGKFEPLGNSEVTATTTAQLGITPKDLLVADSTKVQYGIYDYQFDSIKLNISNPSQVGSGDHSGNINWNLADTPTP